MKTQKNRLIVEEFSSSDKEIEEKDSHPHKLCPKIMMKKKSKKLWIQKMVKIMDSKKVGNMETPYCFFGIL